MILGLNNAGKTAILQVLQDNIKIKAFRTLSPTKGINRENFKIEGIQCTLWDMGGQEDYRKQYLSTPEKNFSNTELIMYVIDVQDKENFSLTLNYLKDITNSLIKIKVSPYFLVLLHKVDPDIRNSKHINENIDYLHEEINEIFAKKTFNYEISISSIFSKVSSNPSLVKEIRKFLNPDETLTDSEFQEQYGKTLETLMDVTIKLCSSVEIRFLEIENSIQDLNYWVKFIREVNDLVKKDEKKEILSENIVQPLDDIKKTISKELKMILNLKSRNK